MLARLDGFDAKSGRTRRKRYERRDDETRRCAAGRRFLFVAPFSVAHPCRQEKGIRLLFFFRPVLLLARSLVPVSSGRIVSSPSRGSVAGMTSWCGRYALTGCGLIWLLVPLSRFEVRSISSYRLAGGWRRAPFLSARFHHSSLLVSVRHSLAAGRIVSLFVSSLFSFVRLVGRLVSILCDLPVVSFPVSLGGSSLSLPVLFIVPWCLVFAFHLAGVSLFRLACPSRQAVRVLVSSGGLFRRLVGRAVFSVSFFPVIGSSCSLRLMVIATAAVCHLRFRLACLVAACHFPIALRHRGAWRWRDGRAARRYEERAVLFSSFSPSGRG